MQDQFMMKNYKHFEDSDENKLIYTTIHKEYVISVLTDLKLNQIIFQTKANFL